VKTTINLFAVLALAASAHATTYSSFFAQIADGGSSNQKWLTTITLTNTSTTAEQTITVQLFADDGTPLALDFGSGPTSTLVATLAPLGSISGRSSGASATITTGWAMAQSSAPIDGVVMYEYETNGVPQQGVSVLGTAPSNGFMTPATSATGFAVANPYTTPVEVEVFAVNQNGGTDATYLFDLASGAHGSATFTSIFPQLGNSWRGTVYAISMVPGTDLASTSEFVVTAISGDGGVLSSYPVIMVPQANNVGVPFVRKPAVQP
jgi:hypothetical protein